MKAIVLYNSRFGSTEKIAKSIEFGLKESGNFETVACTSTGELSSVDSLKEYDILCIGAPTENLNASKSMKEFLDKLKGTDLSGKHAFAFDTKLDSRFSGSAAKHIEKELADQGLKIVLPRESAIVTSIKERGNMVGSKLKDGEEKRFEELGKLLGSATVQAHA